MPAKSNVRKGTSKSTGFKFKWWMAVVLVAVVAVVGVLVLRFSHASGDSYINYTAGVLMAYRYGNGPAPIKNVTQGAKGPVTTDWTLLPSNSKGQSGVGIDSVHLLQNRKYKVCVYGAKVGGNSKVKVRLNLDSEYDVPLSPTWQISCNDHEFTETNDTRSIEVKNDDSVAPAYVGSIVVYPL